MDTLHIIPENPSSLFPMASLLSCYRQGFHRNPLERSRRHYYKLPKTAPDAEVACQPQMDRQKPHLTFHHQELLQSRQLNDGSACFVQSFPFV